MFGQILQLGKDDKNSFKVIFNDFYQPLCHLSQHYLEDEDEAKGVVQEAFVKLWEIRHELNPDSNLRNFLFTLVKNNCLNILKRRQILLKHHEKIRWMEMHYQYEKGMYATIEFNWNDASKTITIGDRKGSFKGMLNSRTFNIVVVNEQNGTGVNVAGKFTKTVKYDGKAKSIKL